MTKFELGVSKVNVTMKVGQATDYIFHTFPLVYEVRDVITQDGISKHFVKFINSVMDQNKKVRFFIEVEET